MSKYNRKIKPALEPELCRLREIEDLSGDCHFGERWKKESLYKIIHYMNNSELEETMRQIQLLARKWTRARKEVLRC